MKRYYSPPNSSGNLSGLSHSSLRPVTLPASPVLPSGAVQYLVAGFDSKSKERGFRGRQTVAFGRDAALCSCWGFKEPGYHFSLFVVWLLFDESRDINKRTVFARVMLLHLWLAWTRAGGRTVGRDVSENLLQSLLSFPGNISKHSSTAAL